ncbi:hypothetical protein F511_24029 [Dorcoceras hygrometricum]|uniref:Uncharacterized protein n=1 Tax=Dorcoceras hygrometricum TaxID=472368 RepID=A0A2Z7BMW4_9LAMI|nr:hypothetical protein F511_24029 [Dorcoceras hygrometricum]
MFMSMITHVLIWHLTILNFFYMVRLMDCLSGHGSMLGGSWWSYGWLVVVRNRGIMVEPIACRETPCSVCLWPVRCVSSPGFVRPVEALVGARFGQSGGSGGVLACCVELGSRTDSLTMPPRRIREQQDDDLPPPPPPPHMTPFERANMEMLAGITRLLERQTERPGKSHEEDIVERFDDVSFAGMRCVDDVSFAGIRCVDDVSFAGMRCVDDVSLAVEEVWSLVLFFLRSVFCWREVLTTSFHERSILR